MMRPTLTRRPGYTLLEVLLATAIALLLLAALYVAMDVTLVRMDLSRGQVMGHQLSRAVAARMTADLTNTLGPLPPRSGGDQAGATSTGSADVEAAAAGSSTGSGGTGGTGGGATTGSGGTGGTDSGGSGGTGGTPPANEPAPAPSGLVSFGMGLIGSQNQLTIFSSAVPRVLVEAEAAFAPAGLPADLKRISYYLASDGSGLCRQERPWVTADGVGNAIDPDRSTEAFDLLAPEVKGFELEYFDGGTWLGMWDGSVTDLDGVALTGPPRAVRVTLTLEFPDQTGIVVQRQMTHTIAIRAAVGNFVTPPPPEKPDPATAASAEAGGAGAGAGASGANPMGGN